MSIKSKRAAQWGIGVIAVVTIGLYAEWVREMANHDPFMLIGCVGEGSTVRAWTCKQVMTHVDWTPDQVAQLNRQAGIEFAAHIDDDATAREMVALFLGRGVDINAGDWHFSGKGRTALHTLASVGNVQGVKLLLDHGARVDVKDADGVTVLDMARKALQMHPDEPSRTEIIHLLEAAERQQVAVSK